MKFRKKPTEIEVERYIDGPVRGMCNCVHPLSGHSGECTEACEKNRYWHVHTVHGPVSIELGDYVAHQKVNGRDDWWPISADTFDATYEKV